MATPVDSPETVDQAAEPQSELWTSDSERGTTTSEELPSGAVDTETGSAEPVPETTPAPVAAADPDRDEAGKFRPKTKKGKPRTDPEARVLEALAEAKAAKEEAARYKAEVEAAKRPTQTAVPRPQAPIQATTTDFPEFDAWSAQTGNSDWNAWMRAAARYEAQQLLTQDRQQTQLQSRNDRYRAGLTDKFPNFAPKPLPVSAAMSEAILSSDLGPDITHWLDAHPEQCAQLAEESKTDDPVVAARWMRKYLETQVTANGGARPDSPAAVRPSAAKPPVNRVGGTANATPADPDDLEFGPEFIRLENDRERKRREAGGRW